MFFIFNMLWNQHISDMQAGDCHYNAAKLHSARNDASETAYALIEAAKMYSRESLDEAMNMYEKAAQQFGDTKPDRVLKVYEEALELAEQNFTSVNLEDVQ